MNCPVECCIECHSIIELLQNWIEITVRLSLRITIVLAEYSPQIIVIGGAAYTYYYLKYRFCSIAEAVSGNTIQIGNKTVRIYGVVALRRGQELCWKSGVCEDGGAYCKRNLGRKVDGRRVCCRVTNWQGAYGRVEGVCSLGGDDLGKWLVREGYAFADRDYSDRYVGDERYARKNGQGFHSAVPVPGPPKEWADSEARSVLVERFQSMGLPGDPTIMTIGELRVKVGFDLSRGMLIDPLGEIGPIELG